MTAAVGVAVAQHSNDMIQKTIFDRSVSLTCDDITFIDGTHEWSFALPFDPKRPDWQLQYAMLERPKPIHELQVYCMLRGHEGTAVFDDVVVAPMLDVACRCGDEEVYRPSKDGECEACPGGSMCVFGFPLHDSADNV